MPSVSKTQLSMCKLCLEIKPPTEYSKNQMRADKNTRKCKECIEKHGLNVGKTQRKQSQRIQYENTFEQTNNTFEKYNNKSSVFNQATQLENNVPFRINFRTKENQANNDEIKNQTKSPKMSPPSSPSIPKSSDTDNKNFESLNQQFEQTHRSQYTKLCSYAQTFKQVHEAQIYRVAGLKQIYESRTNQVLELTEKVMYYEQNFHKVLHEHNQQINEKNEMLQHQKVELENAIAKNIYYEKTMRPQLQILEEKNIEQRHQIAKKSQIINEQFRKLRELLQEKQENSQNNLTIPFSE